MVAKLQLRFLRMIQTVACNRSKKFLEHCQITALISKMSIESTAIQYTLTVIQKKVNRNYKIKCKALWVHKY